MVKLPLVNWRLKGGWHHGDEDSSGWESCWGDGELRPVVWCLFELAEGLSLSSRGLLVLFWSHFANYRTFRVDRVEWEIPNQHGLHQVTPGESLVQCNGRITHYRHQKKWTEKWETISSIKAVRFTPVPWAFPGFVILNILWDCKQQRQMQRMDLCLWLSVSALFIQDKLICWTSYCLHTWAEVTRSWPDGWSLVCLFLWVECSPALQHMQPYCFNILK